MVFWTHALRLKSAHIENFKRFVNLRINDIPINAKLVVLLGPNGCGKSSLFDAFQRQLKVDQFYGMSDESIRYYRRITPEGKSPMEHVTLDFHGDNPKLPEDLKRSLYVRSAYRHDPSFKNTNFQQQPDILDRHTVRRLIDTDQTVQNNYQRIIWRLLRMVTTLGLTTDKIMEDAIGDLQKSMETVFGDIRLDALVAAQDIGTFTFTKRESRNFLYENLSAGEKAAFDLLLDLAVNKSSFNDSLYCIDEPEVHLNTRVQGTLLKELYRSIPENSQLWLATHSIGMVRASQELLTEHPGQVVFLDMGFHADGNLRDYDHPQEIAPAEPDHNFWLNHYSVALDDMAGLLAPDQIVLCEGSTSNDDPALDEACYNRIFAREYPRTRFVSVGPASVVEKRMGDLLPLLEQIIGGTSIRRFRDSDEMTPDEIKDKNAQGVHVLSAYRNIESMLLSDGVLSRLCDIHGKSDQFDVIRTARNSALCHSSGKHAINDLKPAAQAVHQAVRNQLKLSPVGESKHTFMRDVLAPLITSDTDEYQKLKNDIFCNVNQ